MARPISGRHSLTTNWPVITLRDGSAPAKSARPPAWGYECGRRAGGAYTPQRRKPPLSSKSRFERPHAHSGPQGYGETVARELFPDVSRRELAAKRGVFGPHLAYQDPWLGNQRRGLAEYFVSSYPKPMEPNSNHERTLHVGTGDFHYCNNWPSS